MDDVTRYETLEEEDAARRARAPKPRSNASIFIGVLVVTTVVILIVGWFMGQSSTAFSGTVLDFNVIDEANLEVVVELTNEGDEPAVGQCTVEAHDASRVVGFDILAGSSEIQPGASKPYRGAIRIEDEGAFRVLDVTVKDCRED